MFLPLPLLLGLLVVAANTELVPALPGAATLARLLAVLPLLLLPALLAAMSLRLARRSLATGARTAVPPRALLRLSALATPLSVQLVYWLGEYSDAVDRLAADSHLGRMVLSVLPVFLAELPRLGRSTLAATTCDVLGESGQTVAIDPRLLPKSTDVAAFVRMQFGGPLLVALPLLLLGGALDLLQLDRDLYVFVLVTTPGITIGALAFLLFTVALLPYWFKVAFGVAALPEPPGNRLRATAATLGFRPDRVHLLPTGMRALNAMLVGPLPIGRSLCLTDGLVRELDADSLAGVVAHEVGHARKGHPAILLVLVVVVPLLLLTPLRLLDFDGLDVVVRAALVVVGLAGAWFTVRTLAHRFEHEADVASVQALGAGPCTRALQVVSRLAMPVPHGMFGRVFTLHPDEPARWQVMRRYEQEPEFRAHFEAQSRALRRVVVAILLLASALGAFACAEEWRYEHVVWRLHSGDHAQALLLAAGVGDVAPRWQAPWRHVTEELAVVRELAPASTDWPAARSALRDAAWRRGEDVLLAAGPAAARPWLAMGLGATDDPSDLQRALYAYCDAAADHEPERMAAIAAIVRRLGAPPKLAKVFAE